MQKLLVYSVLWSFAGDGKLKVREELGQFIKRSTDLPLPSQQNLPIIDFEVQFQS